LNTINGIANINFFQGLKKNLKCDVPFSLRYPVLSFSFGEVEIKKIGIENCVGNYCCFSYFNSINNQKNEELINKYQSKYGNDKPIDDPMESSYIALNLWMKSKATNKELYKLDFDAPSGNVTVHRNNHVSKRVRIGRINNLGKFDIMYETTGSIYPEPWNKYLNNKHFSCDHQNRGWGAKYSDTVTNYCE
jgi:urea transport system substrate-binding protein